MFRVQDLGLKVEDVGSSVKGYIALFPLHRDFVGFMASNNHDYHFARSL